MAGIKYKLLDISWVFGGGLQETLDLSFGLVEARLQGVPVKIGELILAVRSVHGSPSFAILKFTIELLKQLLTCCTTKIFTID